MKKIFYLVIFISCIFITNVYATNDVDYTLQITKDYDYIETIKYSITSSRDIENGSNYFSSIINDDIYTDITYKNKYKKKLVKQNGKYIVTLSNTYSEYGIGNANFLNNCFRNKKYDYNMDEASFDGSGEFICIYGDSLKIKIITDFEVIDTNATVSGNTYTWYPKNSNFQMKFSFLKTYEKDPSYQQGATGDEGEDFNIPKGTDDIGEKDEKELDKKVEEKETKKTNPIVILSIIGSIMVLGLIIAIILKAKKDSLNKI